jgi:hypothetical protein
VEKYKTPSQILFLAFWRCQIWVHMWNNFLCILTEQGPKTVTYPINFRILRGHVKFGIVVNKKLRKHILYIKNEPRIQVL